MVVVQDCLKPTLNIPRQGKSDGFSFDTLLFTEGSIWTPVNERVEEAERELNLRSDKLRCVERSQEKSIQTIYITNKGNVFKYRSQLSSLRTL